MKLVVLSSKGYEHQGPNYGDCFLIDTGVGLIVYDCGNEAHAKRVENYMCAKGYTRAIVILSHNDADHFDGIPYLVEKGLVSKVYTQLFLKHKEEIMKLLDDGRVTDHSVGERIKTVYSNIASLSKKVTLIDALTHCEIVPGVSIVGPTEDYALETIAKALDSTEGNTIGAETVINAASVQISVDFMQDKCLLCGDASFEAIKHQIGNHSIIQLPHHGKPATANDIFDAKIGQNNTLYIVSDNTGNSNGGSQDLNTVGRRVQNTINGDIIYPSNTTAIGNKSIYPRTLGYTH